MSFTDQFIKEYTGKTVCYPDGLYCGECLSLVKVYIRDRYKISPPASGVGSAYGYWTNFPDPLGSVLKKVENTPDLIPKKGWICVWDSFVGGGDGHIDIVADDKATKSQFNGFDANWNERQAHLVVHNYNNVYGFLAPKDENDGSNEPESGNMSDLEVCLQQHTQLMDQIAEMQTEIDQLEEDKERYKSERDQAREEKLNLSSLNAQLQSELNKCKANGGDSSLEPQQNVEIAGLQMIANGATVTYKNGIVVNYKIKE